MPLESPKIRAVVFDMDDTLYAERDYVRSGYCAVGNHLRQTLMRGERFEEWLWQRFLAGQAGGAFDAMNETFALQLDAAQIQELIGVYRGHRPVIQAFPGMFAMLGDLRSRYALGLLSDGYQPAQRLKFEVLGLDRMFDAVVFTEDVGRKFWKPSPRGFEIISEQLGVPGESCCYVADNPAKDFLPGNQLGWRTIQYLRPGQIHASNTAPQGGLPAFTVRDPEGLHRSLMADRP